MSNSSTDAIPNQPDNSNGEGVLTRTLELNGVDLRLLYGQNDIFLRLIEANFEAQITARGERITFTGSPEEVNQLVALFEDLVKRLKHDDALTDQYIRYAIGIIREGGEGPAERIEKSLSSDTIDIGFANGVKPRTIGQSEYLEAIERSDIVFSIGPAGTGKTFLAVAAAVARLKAGRVKRIILVRPAVEAGETLGFLPGDIRAKVDPYLRPVYDALNDLLSPARVRKLMENNVIEIAPLAFMRGRTLSNAFVVLDEAQNSTTAQMKMFLTRLGENSKAVVTGDITQIDLINRENSGLLSAPRILTGIPGLEFVRLTEKDVVRHRLVQKIIGAYEQRQRRD